MKTKKLLVSLLTLLAVFCMSLSVVMFTNTTSKVRAEGYTEVADSTASFVVADGASVRTYEGTSGMRFIVQMNPTFYNEMSAKTDVKWGALLAEGLADDAVIDFNGADGTAIKDVAWVSLEDENTWGTTPVSIAPYEVDVDNDGTADLYQYTLVISFNTDGKSDAEIAALFGTEFNVRAYVTYTEESEAKVVYSAANANTNRSVVEVAEKVLLEDALNANVYGSSSMISAKEILTAYVNAPYVISPIDALGYIEDFSANTEDIVSGLGVADGEYTLGVAGQSYDITVASGVATLAGVNAIGLNLGENYIAVIKSADGVNYAQELKFVNKAIETEAEFLNEFFSYYTTTEDVTKYYDGATASARYIVLANDINLLSHDLMPGTETEIGTAYDTARASSNRVYNDVLDGQGYTLKADVFFEQYALFSNVKATGGFKNIKLDLGMAYNDANTTARAIFKEFAGTLENVYIDLNKTNTTAGKVNVFQTLVDGMTAKDVFINVDANIPTAVNLFVNYSIYNGWSFNSDPRYNLDNYVVISTAANHKCFSHDDNRAIWASNDGVPQGVANESWDCYCSAGSHTADNQFFAANKFFRYDSADLAIAADKGVIGNWEIQADGTAVWNNARTTSNVNNFAANNTAAEQYASVNFANGIAYVEDFSASTDDVLNGLGVADGTYDITINGLTLEAVVVADGVATVANGSFGELVLGNIYLVTLNDGASETAQQIKYVSQVLNTSSELAAAVTYYKPNNVRPADMTGIADNTDVALFYDGATFSPRYYVLGNDITLNSNWGAEDEPAFNSQDKLFVDVLDGQGYTVTGYSWGAGIFGNIGATGVVKNVGFVLNQANNANYGNGGVGRTGLGIKIFGSAVIENVYIKMSDISGCETEMGWQPICYTSDNGLTLTNVYVYLDSSCVASAEANQMYGYLSGIANVSTWNMTNVVAVAGGVPYAAYFEGGDVRYIASNQADVENFVKVDNLFYYADAAEIPVEQTMVGNWTIDATGNATWVEDSNVSEMLLQKGQAMYLGNPPAGVTFEIEGDAVEVVNGYLVAKKVGVAMIITSFNGEVQGGAKIAVVDAMDDFTATASDAELAVNETATIAIADIAGKAYVGSVAYAVSEAGIVDIAADGTITAVAAGTVEVTVAFYVNGLVATRTVAITVA